MQVPVIGAGRRALGTHPLPVPVCAIARIGLGSLGLNSPIVGMGTNALCICSAISLFVQGEAMVY